MDWMTPDLMWLIGGAIAAGLVRGFAGFGTAMIFLPVVGQVLDPFAAVTVLLIMDLVGPLPAIPRALRDGHPADVIRLVSAMVLTVPLGVMILAYISPESFRYLVALISLTLLICLISGLRYRGTLIKPMIYGTGAASGLLAGSAGIPGPPVILLYMASPHPASVVRANNTVFLLLSDVVILFVLAFFWSSGFVRCWDWCFPNRALPVGQSGGRCYFPTRTGKGVPRGGLFDHCGLGSVELAVFRLKDKECA